DPTGGGEWFDKLAGRAGAVDEYHAPSRECRNQIGVVFCGEIRADQVELCLLTVKSAVPDQDDQHQAVWLCGRFYRGERLAHFDRRRSARVSRVVNRSAILP